MLAAGLIGLCVLVNSPHALVGRLAISADKHREDAVLWWIATAFIAAAVALRRRWPMPMLAVCTAATGVHLTMGAVFTVIDLGVAVLLYTVAVRYSRAASLTLLALQLVLVTGWSVFAAVSGKPVPGLPDLIPSAVAPGAQVGSPAARHTRSVAESAWTGTLVLGSILVASWATGFSNRSRRAYLDELHARAEDLERQRDQQAQLAAAAERARITRELHDVVAHGLSVMVTQAQGAEAILDIRPADTRTALTAIIKTGRDSLADMRRALANDHSGTGSGTDAWHPQPGLDRLPTLVSQVTAAGTLVRLHINGKPAVLPSAVDLSAYRLVQEALTNTMKHAGPRAEAEVTITYYDTGLDIRVSDNGRGAAGGDGRGNGLRGMHERVRLLGGRLTTGPAADGDGFTVSAVFPLSGSDA
nr:histidine kinase [Allorhizocola rhizosphaerae]